mmetsp:Transcript_87520/g.231595  ORF Transcript_87520/g.231595 Transcript_87520/m.231595 type:complete len:459 (+) Transcript_87520:471-1847(+)
MRRLACDLRSPKSVGLRPGLPDSSVAFRSTPAPPGPRTRSLLCRVCSRRPVGGSPRRLLQARVVRDLQGARGAPRALLARDLQRAPRAQLARDLQGAAAVLRTPLPQRRQARRPAQLARGVIENACQLGAADVLGLRRSAEVLDELCVVDARVSTRDGIEGRVGGVEALLVAEQRAGRDTGQDQRCHHRVPADGGDELQLGHRVAAVHVDASPDVLQRAEVGVLHGRLRRLCLLEEVSHHPFGALARQPDPVAGEPNQAKREAEKDAASVREQVRGAPGIPLPHFGHRGDQNTHVGVGHRKLDQQDDERDHQGDHGRGQIAHLPLDVEALQQVNHALEDLGESLHGFIEVDVHVLGSRANGVVQPDTRIQRSFNRLVQFALDSMHLLVVCLGDLELAVNSLDRVGAPLKGAADAGHLLLVHRMGDPHCRGAEAAGQRPSTVTCRPRLRWPCTTANAEP